MSIVVSRVSLVDIHPDPSNARVHDERNLDTIAASLTEHGQYAPLVVQKSTGRILKGNGTYQAMKKLKWGACDAYLVDIDDLQATRLSLVDNRSSELATWDDETLALLLQQVGDIESIGWNDSEFKELLSSIDTGDTEAGDAEDVEAQVDKADELMQKWGTELGQVWEIDSATAGGVHRIICGDCTDKAVVERLMGSDKATMLLTDPPYGINRDKGFGGSRGFNGMGSKIKSREYTDEWDKDRPSADTLLFVLSLCKNAIIFGGNFFADILPRSYHWIVWDKLNTMPTFGDCELAWTNIDRTSVKKIVHEYNGLIGKEKERFHPTQKPVKLFAHILQEYTKAGDCILDPFLGSGTTIAACEQTGRIGRGVEIAPEYVAVSLQRLSDMGLETRRLDTVDVKA